ncbi:NADH-ubiquinone oxidoreductase-F iron-sulfur binding region domain-containing protein [Breoghania sp. L-A4]|uniref:NADH-ubiquinone oxidoreductase-F iron-sulfur binding region domain-containing protein n=1 Tax=Breoghania sp. L-A4 TaxID=2304600 RepID=UPI000E35E74C|nr:NADH-ubiquinone oxidoreductase-F iron-sulfur binding region domain-containing protein [Breoghania sp. L-A4]AXS38958.1 NADH-quinone oxidoreductase subunit F [Breoghania sp. L-A4]
MLKNGAKRRDNSKPKGRPLDLTALYDVETLLGEEARTPDLLIEHLHKLQDKFGCLHARHLRALADAMRLSQAEVFEVASFYHHFDIVTEDGTAPAPLTVRVCDSLSCALAGGEALAERLEGLCDSQNVRVQRVPCIGRCQHAPAAQVGKRAVDVADEGKIISTIAAGDTTPEIPAYTDLAAYQADGGYALLKAVKAGEHTVESLIELMSDAGLRGLGGAGFPVGRKWSIVREQPSPRLMTVNADEGEPGTFKDRAYLESDPHRMLEGALIAANVVGAQRIYIYLRDEYPAAHEILTREIAALDAAGLTKEIGIDLRRGAGAYICGEESAMIESIEGKRGLPRNRPPYIAQVGLFGRPTLNHNVETLFWIRDIVQKGADWFASQGRRDHKGLRSFSVSGRVKNPGVKLAPAGITVLELIEEFCGGMADGHAFKGYLPGGASGGILPASLGDIPLDFGTLEKHGSFVGSHAVVILSDKDDMRQAALNLMRFFKHESCGQCTPCRSGTEKMVDLLASGNWDKDLIHDLEQVMRDASICGLGQAASNPVRTVMTFFAKEGM